MMKYCIELGIGRCMTTASSHETGDDGVLLPQAFGIVCLF